MEEVRSDYTKIIKAIKVLVILALIAYGGYSVYTLYLLIPEKITEHLLVAAAFGLGGLVAGFVPLGLFFSLADGKDERVPRYIYTVLLALFSIPIMIYGAYRYKLQHLNNYSIENNQIRYRLSATHTVDDRVDPDSMWRVYFTDEAHNEIDTEQIYEVSKYDVISCVANIECCSHYIEDREYPVANYNDSTVQRAVVLCFGNKDMNTVWASDDVTVYDTNGNMSKVHLMAKAERVIPVWDVLLAPRSDRKDFLDELDVTGEECYTLTKKYWNYDDEVLIDSDTYISSYDNDCRLVTHAKLYTKNVGIDMFAENSGYYEAVKMNTLDPLTDSESDEFYSLLLKTATEKYGTSDDDYVEDYEWYHTTDDRIYMLSRKEDEENEGYYIVSFLIVLRDEAEQHMSELVQQPGWEEQ